MKSIETCCTLLKQRLDEAEAVVIGAGAGLSLSAGFSYSDRRFQEHFADFIARYGFQDMYSAGFYPFPSLEEFWAYWSRYIFINRYQDPPRPVYRDLLEAVRNKEYFVLTTNVDHCFQKAGFEKTQLFYTQGDYGLFQCSEPCHKKTYDNESCIRRMVKEQRDMRVPAELVPHCPACGKPMTVNLRADQRFVEDAGWHRAEERYSEFLRRHRESRVLFWELGTGYNTPAIIRNVLPGLTYQNPKAFMIRVNLFDAAVPNKIKDRSVSLYADCGEAISELLRLSRK